MKTTEEQKKKKAEYQKKWRHENPDKYAAMLEKQKLLQNWKKENKPGWWQGEKDRKNADRRSKYGNDPEYTARILQYRKDAYRRVREQILAAYNAKCECCGETEKTFLELDHVNGGGAAHYREVNAETNYKRVIREGFPDKYQLLCCNCNRGRARHGGICPHKLRPQ